MEKLGIAAKTLQSVLACFMASLLAFGAISTDAYAEMFEGDYTYEYSGEGVSITGYTGSETEITIPREIAGEIVVGISINAFRGNDSIESVRMPETVLTIGPGAFEGCKALRKVELPNGIESIEYVAFSGTGLESVEIPASVEDIDELAFNSCRNLREISVDSQNEKYFSDNAGALYTKEDQTLIAYPLASEVDSYTVAAGTKQISDWVFMFANNLREVTFGEGVESIGTLVFYNCANLETVNISSTVETIDKCAFSIGLQSLQSINVDLDNETFSVDSAGVLYDNINKWLIRCPARNPKISGTYNVKEETRLICEFAFENTQVSLDINEIFLPNSVVEISQAAFLGAAKAIHVPSSVETFGSSCFIGASKVYVGAQAQYELLKGNLNYIDEGTEVILVDLGSEDDQKNNVLTYLAAIEFADVCAKYPGSSVSNDFYDYLKEGPSVWEAAMEADYFIEPIWNDADVKRSDLAIQELDGWDIVGSSNSPNYLVYAKDGQCIIAFASKDNFDFRGYEDYVENAEIVYEDAANNYGANNVFVTGAGLGGALASYLCTLHDADGAIFNASGTGFDTAFVNNYADITGFEGVDAMKCVHYYTPEYSAAHSDDDSTDNLHSFPYALVSSNGKASEAESLSAMYSYEDGEFSFNGVTNEGKPSESDYRFVDKPSELFEMMFAILRGDWTAPLDPKWDFLYAGTSADDQVDVTFLENAMPLTVLAGDSGNGIDDIATGVFGDTIVSGPGWAELDGGLGADTFVVSEDAEGVEIDDYTSTGVSTLVALKKYFDVANAFSSSGAISWDGAKGTYKLLKHIAENGIFQTDKVYLEGASFDDVEAERSGDYLVLSFGGTKVWVNEHRYFGQDLDIIDKNGEVRKTSDFAAGASARAAALSADGLEHMIAQIALQGAEKASIVDRASGAVLLELTSDTPVDEYEEYGYFHVEDDGAFRFVYDASLVDVKFTEGTITKLEALNAEGDKPATIQSQAVKGQIELGAETLEVTKDGQDLDFLLGGSEADLEREDVSTSDRDAVQLSAGNVADVPEQEWTGQPVEPKPTVSVGGVELVEGTDFDYSWVDNTDEGTATVVVTGKGAYTGQVAKEFSITKTETEEPGTGPGTGGGEEEGGDPSEPSEPSNPSNPGTPTTPSDHEVSLSFDATYGSVEVSDDAAAEGETVTVTAVPLFGYEVESVSVTDGSGKAVEAVATEDGKWTFSMPDEDASIAVKFAPTAWDNPYSDVTSENWFWNPVRRASMAGLMHGYGDGTFGPGDGLAREQAATVMWNLMGCGDETRPPALHADVAQGEWYSPYVNWAVDSKVMEGYDSGEFGVGDALTREQFAAVIAKAVGADVDAADRAALEAFPDSGGVSGWATATMAWAVENGLVNGVETEDGARELQATRILTRAEMATMMMNAIDKGILKLDA